MAQSLTKIFVHIIFSTKNREPHLRDKRTRDALFAFMAGVCAKLDSRPIIIGGTADHAHILCSLSKNCSVADLVKEIKRASTRWLKEKYNDLSDFYWQNGYGAFSVSTSQLGQAEKYVSNQAEHHRKMSFQDEYRKFLAKYRVEYDERYLWD